jgi:hypothetical protein
VVAASKLRLPRPRWTFPMPGSMEMFDGCAVNPAARAPERHPGHCQGGRACNEPPATTLSHGGAPWAPRRRPRPGDVAASESARRGQGRR